MPVIDGQVFAEHEHREYPKALYPSGAAYDDGKPVSARIVSNPEEEAEAVSEGFAPITPDAVADDNAAALAEDIALAGGEAAVEAAMEPEAAPPAEDFAPETSGPPVAE